MATTQRTYTFYDDPGHAWLEVPKQDIRTLRVSVTPWSYMCGPLAYLEEDCDAPAFLRAARDAGWMIDIREERDTMGIRRMPQYR